MSFPKNSPDFSVDTDQLKKDLADIAAQKDEVSSATGGLRSTIKSILDDRGYHKNALKIIREIDDMPGTKKADFLRTFSPMFEALLPGWESQVQDMLDKMDTETSEMEGDME